MKHRRLFNLRHRTGPLEADAMPDFLAEADLG
jgi:hypothetical protein